MNDRDKKRLIGCDARLIDKVDRVLARMATEGHEMVVTSGARTAAEQQRLYAKGRSAPGRVVTYADGVKNLSNHQRGRAADLAFLVDGQPSWSPGLPWQLYADTAIEEGLAAGYYWKRPDRPHVELHPDDKVQVVKV